MTDALCVAMNALLAVSASAPSEPSSESGSYSSNSSEYECAKAQAELPLCVAGRIFGGNSGN